MLTDLLPCPFCGGQAAFEEMTTDKYPYTTWSVGCANVDEDCIGYQMLASFSRKHDAAAAWNKRAPTSLPHIHDEQHPTSSLSSKEAK